MNWGIAKGLIWLGFLLVATKSWAAPCTFKELTIREPSDNIIQVRYDEFSEKTITKNGRIYDVVDFTERVLSDTTDLLWLEYENAVVSKIPKNSCAKHYIPHSHRLDVQSDGTVLGISSVRFQKRGCNNVPWICCKGLKCKRCKVLTKSIWYFKKTFDLYTVITPYVNPGKNNWSIRTSTRIDDRGGISRNVLNFLNIMSFGTLGEKINQDYNRGLNNMRAQLPILNIPRDFKDRRKNVKVKLEDVKFSSDDDKIYVQFTSTLRLKPSIACNLFEGVNSQTR